MFQSTPAIADGRTPVKASVRQNESLFQATPASAAGRTAAQRAQEKEQAVSIHARHR